MYIYAGLEDTGVFIKSRYILYIITVSSSDSQSCFLPLLTTECSNCHTTQQQIQFF